MEYFIQFFIYSNCSVLLTLLSYDNRKQSFGQKIKNMIKCIDEKYAFSEKRPDRHLKPFKKRWNTRELK